MEYHLNNWEMLDAIKVNDVSKVAAQLTSNPSPKFFHKVIDEVDCSLMDYAINFGYYQIVRLLASAGACIDPEYEVEHANELRLWTAVLRGDLDELRRRIDAGDSVDQAPQGGEAEGWTALWLAVRLGREDAARMLLQAGANVNAADYERTRPLHLALEGGQFDIVQLLVEAEADVNAADDYGQVPLHIALKMESVEFIKVLVDAGANVQALDNDGKSPLHRLLDDSYCNMSPTSISKTFTLLTDAGATVDGATTTISPLVPSDVIRAIVPEDTPFWLAANNDAPMLAAELAGGLNPNMRTENGMTLLHWACAGDAPECVQLLLDAGAEMEPIVKDDRVPVIPTPIFYCIHESSDCLECMIGYGADVNFYCSYPLLPFDLALAANSPACLTALVGAGAWEEDFNQRYDFIQSALCTRPVPVDALLALLAAAGERVLEAQLAHMPPLYYAVKNSTVDGVRVLVEAGADATESYKEYKGGSYENVLQLAKHCLSCNPAETPRLTAIVDYLKSLPCFSEEQ